ncbi:MAG: acyloxyacyl hydrolase [Gemmatimonadetes bacterium]|nr:acyloxyacyl hydrolase [Gemmatimonadota bacterium]
MYANTKIILLAVLIAICCPVNTYCQEAHIGFGLGTGVAFPMMNQTEFPCDLIDVLFFDEACHISFPLASTQMGPVVNGEFFIGDEQVDLVLHGSFFSMPQRYVQNTLESRIFNSGGWLSSFLLEFRYKILANKPFAPYWNAGLGAFYFRPNDHRNLSSDLYFHILVGIGSEFAFQRKDVRFFTEIRFQFMPFRVEKENIADEITGTVNFTFGCRFWLSSN